MKREAKNQVRFYLKISIYIPRSSSTKILFSCRQFVTVKSVKHRYNLEILRS